MDSFKIVYQSIVNFFLTVLGSIAGFSSTISSTFLGSKFSADSVSLERSVGSTITIKKNFVRLFIMQQVVQIHQEYAYSFF